MRVTPLISVLVPCFNVEKYLVECLDSIVAQSYKNLEIICLNDGSTDSTLDIIKSYASKDERFVVVDKSNSGYGASMNIGLKKATGEYLAIVESDDYIEPTMFEDLLKAMQDNDLDLARCTYREWNEITGSEVFVDYTYDVTKGKVVNPLECQDVLLGTPSIWAAMYKMDVLRKNDIWFLETPGASYQDTSFAFKAYIASKRVMALPKQLHHYRINGNSSVNSPGKLFYVCDEEAEIRRFVAERGLTETLKEAMAFRSFGSYRWNYDRLATLSLKRQFMKRWSVELKAMFRNGEMTGRYYSKNRRMRLWLAAYCPFVYYFTKKF